MRFLKYIFAVVVLSVGSFPELAHAQSLEITDEWNTPEARQFDFWIGEWDVNLRMIQPDKTWKDSVKAKVKIYPVLGGRAILELWDSKPIKGFSLRYYDPAKKKWVLYLNWPNRGRSTIGTLKGEFRHGRGEFFSTTQAADGKETISRYTFCDITENSLRWDDAFSRDGGKTWTNNWIMEFTRTAAVPDWPDSDRAHTFVDGNRCQGPEFDLLNSVAGHWQGSIHPKDDADQSLNVVVDAYQVLDGCSVLVFQDVQGKDQEIADSFSLLTFNRQAGKFEWLTLGKAGATTFSGLQSENAIVFKKNDKDETQLELVIPADANSKLKISRRVSTGSQQGDWVVANLTKAKRTGGPAPKENSNVESAKAEIVNGIYLVKRWTETKNDLFPLLTDERYFEYDENKFYQLEDDEPEPIRHIGLSKTEFIPFKLQEKPQPIPQDDGRMQIELTFSKDVSRELTSFSRKYLGRQVATVIGGEIVTLHKVRSVIKSDGIKISRCTDDGCQLIMSKFEE